MSESTESLVGELATGEYDYVDIDDLNEHPKNTDIYGEIDPDETFVEDIERNGVETPLVVNEHEDCPDTVIGGHRRLTAAKQAGLNRVPVRWVSYPEPMATRRVVLNNNQRDKTPKQQSQEALVLEETAREMDAAGQGSRNDTSSQLRRSDFRWDEDVGEQIGVSKDSIRRGTDVFRFAYPDEYVNEEYHDEEKYDVPEEVRKVARQQVEKMDDGQSFYGAKVAVKNAIEKAEKEERRKKLREKFRESDEDSIEIYEGDFTEVLSDYDPGSVDHIITDPPYDEDALKEWDALGEEAARLLPEDGFLVAYSGKAHLPEVYDVMTDHLDYYWQFVVNHKGPGAKIFSRTLRTNYKPILVFTPESESLPERDQFVSDVIDGDGIEKDDHEWQQAEAETAELVEAFSDPNDHVLDPMAGSGTTGVACKRLDRRCTLIDRDPEAIEAIQRRWLNE